MKPKQLLKELDFLGFNEENLGPNGGREREIFVLKEKSERFRLFVFHEDGYANAFQEYSKISDPEIHFDSNSRKFVIKFNSLKVERSYRRWGPQITQTELNLSWQSEKKHWVLFRKSSPKLIYDDIPVEITEHFVDKVENQGNLEEDEELSFAVPVDESDANNTRVLKMTRRTVNKIPFLRLLVNNEGKFKSEKNEKGEFVLNKSVTYDTLCVVRDRIQSGFSLGKTLILRKSGHYFDRKYLSDGVLYCLKGKREDKKQKFKILCILEIRKGKVFVFWYEEKRAFFFKRLQRTFDEEVRDNPLVKEKYKLDDCGGMRNVYISVCDRETVYMECELKKDSGEVVHSGKLVFEKSLE